MPGNYAHYRLGTRMIAGLPADMERTVCRFRQLYDVGLHGPDLFFFYSPLTKSTIGSLGRKFHHQTGQEFFGRCVRLLRLQPSEAGRAYLYGLLAHYALDAACHPYIKELHSSGQVDHARLESEFDRVLLAQDGKPPEFAQAMGQHLQLTPGECQTVAAFYPPAKAHHIKKSIKNMAFYSVQLAAPAGAKRRLLEKGMKILSPGNLGMLMPLQEDAACTSYIQPLLEQYAAAEERFPALLCKLQSHLTRGEALDEEFAAIFG